MTTERIENMINYIDWQVRIRHKGAANMKKYISKILIMVLFSSLMIVTPIFAEESEENKEGLTYSQAFELAVNNSLTLKNLKLDKERNFIMKDETGRQVAFIPAEYSNNPSASMIYTTAMKTEINYQASDKQIELQLDKLFYNVKKAYNAIFMNIEDLKAAEENAEFLATQKKITDVKHKLGLASNLEKKVNDNAYLEAIAQYNTALLKLEDSYYKLNTLLGLPEDQEPILAEKIVYQQLEMDDEDLAVLINRVTSNSTPIWLQEQYVTLADYDVRYFVFNNPADFTPYDAKEIDLQKSRNQLRDSKNKIADAITSIYYAINQLEASIETIKLQLENAENGLEIARIQGELGIIIPIEVQERELMVNSLNNHLNKLYVQHDELIETLFKPWVLN